MPTNNVTWKIGGEAGMGIKVIGLLVTKLFTRAGLHAIGNSEYPSLIRGGHNNFTLRVSTDPIFAYDPLVDILVALNQETLELNRDHVRPGGAVIYEDGKIDLASFTDSYKGVRFINVPLTAIVKEVGGDSVLRNVASVGASLGLLGVDISFLHNLLKEIFGDKGEAVVRMNAEASQKAYDLVKKQNIALDHRIEPIKNEKRMVIAGNEALAMGALRGGLKLYCAYPMTPSTPILHFLAEHEKEFNIVVKQTEDEIAAINMAIGGAFMGARSMVATSGGGFSLMVEGLGLAAITETPVVVVLGQRPGPSTGLPTWTSQGDLRFALHAAQDEFLRVVIAPGDVEECFFAGAHALQLAEKYQVPVIILTDKFVGESYVSHPFFDETKIQVTRESFADDTFLESLAGNYRRYALTESGVTPRSIPGQRGGTHLANSDEHDAYGFSEESEKNRQEQMDKRLKKASFILEELPSPTVYGDQNAEITLITWGSAKAAARQAQIDLEKEGIKTRVIHNMYLYPFPSKFYEEQNLDPQKTVIVEGNLLRQFAGLLREHTGFSTLHHINKNTGRPFYTSDVVEYVKDMLGSSSS